MAEQLNFRPDLAAIAVKSALRRSVDNYFPEEKKAMVRVGNKAGGTSLVIPARDFVLGSYRWAIADIANAHDGKLDNIGHDQVDVILGLCHPDTGIYFPENEMLKNTKTGRRFLRMWNVIEEQHPDIFKRIVDHRDPIEIVRHYTGKAFGGYRDSVFEYERLNAIRLVKSTIGMGLGPGKKSRAPLRLEG